MKIIYSKQYMLDKIAQLLAEVDTLKAKSAEEVEALRIKYLSKKGEITSLMNQFRDVPAEQKKEVGMKVNQLKQKVTDKINELKEQLDSVETGDNSLDLTRTAYPIAIGTRHPLTIVKNEIIDIFSRLGFTMAEGPEVEDDWHVYSSMNFAEDHPARDMQDTFYVSPELLLRTQTSAGQIRVMENTKPPIKILSPGKVFRSDDDATHSPMFSQMEGLVVDKGITLCDLQGMLDEFARNVFGEGVRTRLRPSYFPFTEPSVEVDVSCFECGGKGCRLCKDTGWIEVLGAGMVNRKVLENCGIDPDVYTGFAFGMGIERIAMLKYGIPNIKMLFESDVRVLSQFHE